MSVRRDQAYKEPAPMPATDAEPQQPPLPMAEADCLLTPAPRYRCAHCFMTYIKWSQCKQHIVTAYACRRGIQDMITSRDPDVCEQDLCKIVSAATEQFYQ